METDLLPTLTKRELFYKAFPYAKWCSQSRLNKYSKAELLDRAKSNRDIKHFHKWNK